MLLLPERVVEQIGFGRYCLSRILSSYRCLKLINISIALFSSRINQGGNSGILVFRFLMHTCLRQSYIWKKFFNYDKCSMKIMIYMYCNEKACQRSLFETWMWNWHNRISTKSFLSSRDKYFPWGKKLVSAAEVVK